MRPRGVAEALGIDPGSDRFDTAGIPYNMAMSLPDCSSVYYPPSTTDTNHGCLSRNYDFCIVSLPEVMGKPQPDKKPKPVMAEPYVIEMYPADGGYSSLSLVAFDLLSAEYQERH